LPARWGADALARAGFYTTKTQSGHERLRIAAVQTDITLIGRADATGVTIRAAHPANRVTLRPMNDGQKVERCYSKIIRALEQKDLGDVLTAQPA
jgi:hypothetical protein